MALRAHRPAADRAARPPAFHELVGALHEGGGLSAGDAEAGHRRLWPALLRALLGRLLQELARLDHHAVLALVVAHRDRPHVPRRPERLAKLIRPGGKWGGLSQARSRVRS